MQSNSPDEPQTTSPNRKPKKLFRWITLALLLLGLGPYLYSRFQAPQNRVQQFDSGGNTEVQRTFGSELSIVSFNIAHGRGTASSNWTESLKAKPSTAIPIQTLDPTTILSQPCSPNPLSTGSWSLGKQTNNRIRPSQNTASSTQRFRTIVYCTPSLSSIKTQLPRGRRSLE